MEIASYPVPIPVPVLPSVTEVGLSTTVRQDTSSNTGSRTAQERVLQGEYLNRGNQNKTRESGRDRLLFEQRASRQRPDLSGLGARQREAITSYLDNEDLSVSGYPVRSLIDEYV